MSLLSFTQFLRPNGQKQTVSIEVPEDIYSQAQALKDKGYSFEVEVLTTGFVHFEIIHHGEEDILSSEICVNGPPVVESVHRLIKNATRVLNVRGV